MRVIIFSVTCRPHNIYEKITIAGAATLRNIDRGYDRAYEVMERQGCNETCPDAGITYTATRDDSVRPTLKMHQANEDIS